MEYRVCLRIRISIILPFIFLYLFREIKWSVATEVGNKSATQIL